MRVLVALGSNLGDRLAHLQAGLEGLRELGEVITSPLVMETPDESGTGPAYLNTIAWIDTDLDNADLDNPCRILEALLRLELRMGRSRRGAIRNAPRTLDLDLIDAEGLSGNWRWPTPQDLADLGPELTLELPHPRALARPFVMEPLKALKYEAPHLFGCGAGFCLV